MLLRKSNLTGDSDYATSIAVLGLNHTSAPLSVRETIAFSADEVTDVLGQLDQSDYGVECVILSTCNRTELYLAGRSTESALPGVLEVLDEYKGATVLRNTEWTYTHHDADAVNHLFRVTSGLDSLMVGETQIMTQVKSAYDLAAGSRKLDIVLNRLLQGALHVGKRTRSETDIGVGAVSISSAAVGLAEKVFGELNDRTALLVGAGETARLAAEHLRERKIGRLLIANRTPDRAETLAGAVGGTAVPFDDRASLLQEVDIVISVTGAPTLLFTEQQIADAMRQRPRRTLLAIDLAVPRDIDPAANSFDNVFLYDVDALEVMVEQSLTKRRKEIPKVERIVQAELTEFLEWYESLAVTPLIRELREHLEQIRMEQIDRYGHQFNEKDREQLDQFTRTMMNRILHQPLTRLRDFTRDTQWGALRLDTVRELFGLEDIHGESNQDRDTQ
jgi:glutamyl-tRNA reductase